MRKTFILFMALSAVFGCKKGGVQKDTGVYPWIGAEKPKVLVVAFMDYQCPNSAKLVSVLQDVLREFPDLVKVEFRNNPLNVHADSEISAAAALAAHNQGKFSEYYVKLFKNQSNLSEADLLKYAEDTGLDPESFKTDMKGERIKTLVARDKKIAAALAIQGTPHSFVNGRSIIGAYPLERFKAIVIEEIKKFDEMKNKGIAEDKIIALLGAERNSLYDRLVARNEEPPETQRQKEKVPVPDAVFHVRVEDDDPFEGNPQAPVTIVEFGNYLCPWTVKSGELISSLLSDYKGKVRFVFKQNPLDALKDAHIFSEAALAAASQGKFWEFHRVLFRNSGNLKQENLLAYAGEAGLDLEAFKTALEKKAFYERVEGDRDSAALAGAKGTPNFFINGRKIVGLRKIEDFREVIEEELKKAEAMLASGIASENLYAKIMESGMTIKPLDDKLFKFDLSSSPSLRSRTGKDADGASGKLFELALFVDFTVPGNLKTMKFLSDFLGAFDGGAAVFLKSYPVDSGSGGDAVAAAKAIYCAAEQGKLLNLLGGMFNSSPPVDRTLLIKIAGEGDMEKEKFSSCLDSEKYAAAIKRDIAEADNAGVKSTPVLFINGRRFNPFLGWDAENLGRTLKRYAE